MSIEHRIPRYHCLLTYSLLNKWGILSILYTVFQTHPPPTCLLPRSCFSCPSAPAMSELPSLKWLIFGCGGVGGYFGARIAQVKGQRVSYIAACLQKSDIQKSDLIRFDPISLRHFSPARLHRIQGFMMDRNVKNMVSMTDEPCKDSGMMA